VWKIHYCVVCVRVCVCCVCVTCTFSGVDMHPSIRTYIYSCNCSCMWNKPRKSLLRLPRWFEVKPLGVYPLRVGPRSSSCGPLPEVHHRPETLNFVVNLPFLFCLFFRHTASALVEVCHEQFQFHVNSWFIESTVIELPILMKAAKMRLNIIMKLI